MLTFVFKHPLIIALGFGLIVLGLYLSWRKHCLLLTGHLTDGEVVRLIPHVGSKGGTTYTAQVAYTQPDGTRTEFESGFSSNPPMHQVGEKVRVVYYPDREKPDILAFADLYLFPWACVCAGLFILMMCAGFIYGPPLIDAIYLPHLANPDPLKTMGLIKE